MAKHSLELKVGHGKKSQKDAWDVDDPHVAREMVAKFYTAMAQCVGQATIGHKPGGQKLDIKASLTIDGKSVSVASISVDGVSDAEHAAFCGIISGAHAPYAAHHC
jgi:hypothetical protein